MKFFLLIIFLLGISRDIFGKGIRRKKNNDEVELSYQDLKNLNISCYPSDSCKQVRSDDGPVPALEAKCSCHSQCWEYGTCCIDSPYRVKRPIQKCMFESDKYYYMVHRCPDNTHPDSIWKNHCERELNWDDDVDILMISPVTSLDTSRTYKNYYCFRCHEKTDKYVPWNLEVISFDDALRGANVYSVVYNQTASSWVAILDGSGVSLPVVLNFVFPQSVKGELIECGRSELNTDCFDSTDKDNQAKCNAYSAVVYSEFGKYKNVHCALCNYVPLDSLSCNSDVFDEGNREHGGGAGQGFDNSVRILLDLNYNKQEQCKGDNKFWNHFTKICQEPVCNIRGYVIKNDTCVKP